MSVEQAIWVLGLRSGLSLGGIEGAMILTDGVEVVEFGATGFRPYQAGEKAAIEAALRAGDQDGARVVLGVAVADFIARFGGVSVIGVDDLDGLANADAEVFWQGFSNTCTIPIARDMRSADIEAGGQGGPLTPLYQFALARRKGEGSLAFLELGKTSRVCFVDMARPVAELPDAVLAFETGPGTGVLDRFAMERTGLACDYGGALASLGQVDDTVLGTILGEGFFSQKPPKTCSDQLRAMIWENLKPLNDTDGLATLVKVISQAIKAGFKHCPEGISKCLVSGGGRNNPTLMAALSSKLKVELLDMDKAGLDGAMMRTQAVAYMALRVRDGLALTVPGSSGASAPTSGGQMVNPAV